LSDAEKRKVKVMETREKMLGADTFTWKEEGRDAENAAPMRLCTASASGFRADYLHLISYPNTLASWGAGQSDVSHGERVRRNALVIPIFQLTSSSQRDNS
jgi:hypothetical protein